MADRALIIIGNHISPFVRKVLAVCEVKGLPYAMDSIVPFFGTERFARLSPLRRIPVLIDGDVVLNDSSVICEYLEDKWPERPVLPKDPAARAQARFLDEYADTRIADVLLWKVFGRALVAPAIFKAERDVAAIQRTIAQEVPAVLDHLEAWAPQTFTMGDTPGVADFSVASHFVNYRWARGVLDAARWPKVHAWVTRVEACAPMQRLNEIGAKILRVPPDAHAATLREMGVPVAAETVGGTSPQRGPMTAI
ncbi:MAG: glutathione S-transferase family protein [Hyphomicrobiales bacterium]|nr:MAG: glutathione S-transferase family protein [Hyphomicrobiales bacterium]